MNLQNKPSISESSQPLLTDKKIILGIDIGTSGVRACLVEKITAPSDYSEKILFESQVDMHSAETALTNNSNTLKISQNPQIWIDSVETLLEEVCQKTSAEKITHIVLDATSSTVLLVDVKGHPLCNALMYNDAQSVIPAKEITELIKKSGEFSGAQGASSTLAKVVTLLEQNPGLERPIICHQIDFINHYLCGILNVTDENNALKLGYNSINQAWPNWIEPYLKTINSNMQLPKVVKPGDFIAEVSPHVASQFGFSANLRIMAGTTDSIAGFLASGASQVGDAVSSLGSTLAIKAISNTALFDERLGLYSHRLGNNWLVGGASNSGGRVLLNHYSLSDLIYITQNINDREIEDYLKSQRQTYYPLNQKGERFPIADAYLAPKMPNPPLCSATETYRDPACLKAHKEYLLGLLCGITEIEKLAYQKLEELGMPPIRQVFSVGGGTQNTVWMRLRKILIDIRFTPPKHQQAAYGVTKLIN